MFVCIPSKDNSLLYNIFEEEAGQFIVTIKHPSSAHAQEHVLSIPGDTSEVLKHCA